MRKSNQGFTLIELIMVIVILGILSAFALPRFANFSGDARGASVEGVAAAMKSASAISHAKWLISGGSLDSDSIDIESATIGMGDGYPTVAGIVEAIGGPTSIAQYIVSGTAAATVTTRVDSPSGIADIPAKTLWNLSGANNDTCSVGYQEAQQINGTGAGNPVTSPVITFFTDGC